MELFRISDNDAYPVSNRHMAFRGFRMLNITWHDGKELQPTSTSVNHRFFCPVLPLCLPVKLQLPAKQFVKRRSVQPKQSHFYMERYLRSILLNEHEAGTGENHQFLARAKIITQAATLQHLMQTPYVREHDWTVVGSKFMDKYFLHMSPESGCLVSDSKADIRAACLRNICFRDTCNDPRGDNDMLDDNMRFTGIHQVDLNDLTLMYSSDFYGHFNDMQLVDNFFNYKDLAKVRPVIVRAMGVNYGWRLRPEILDMACESYLLASDDLCLGFHYPDGTMTDPVRIYTITDLIEHQSWHLFTCTAFLYKFLTKVMKFLDVVEPFQKSYSFTYSHGKSNVVANFLDADMNGYMGNDFARMFREQCATQKA